MDSVPRPLRSPMPHLDPVLPPARELTLLVYRQMRALTGPHRDLDDLAQTALEQILRSSYRGEAKLSTFTHSVCYHVWVKHLRFSYRFRARFALAETDEQVSGVDATDPASLLADRRRFLRLYEALERVSVKRRAVVALHDVSGLDVPEIASIVGASEATVRTRLRDGRKKLRALLARDPEFSEGASDAPPQNPQRQELPCPQS
jgi:RNA polymerase sigma factor (sigma-70 family)